MSKTPEHSVSMGSKMDAQTYQDLQRLHERLGAVGICPMAEAMLGTAVGALIQAFGGAEASAILDEWVHIVDAMSADFAVDDEPTTTKPARKRGKV